MHLYGSDRWSLDIYFYNGKKNLVGEIYYDSGEVNKVTTGILSFRQFSPNTTPDESTTGFFEKFSFPQVDTGRTANATYSIITTKNLSNITSVGTITTGTWKGSIIGTAYGGTGVNSHTQNRLVWSNGAGTIQATDNHYASATKIAINSNSEPTENLYVDGTVKISNTVGASSAKGSSQLQICNTITDGAQTAIELRRGSLSGTTNGKASWQILNGATLVFRVDYKMVNGSATQSTTYNNEILKLRYNPNGIDVYGNGVFDESVTVKSGGIWVQGGSEAGGDDTRMGLTNGMPDKFPYNSSKRGTYIYSNAIAFADPLNGNSNNDAGWIRHIEETGNKGTLEIAVGDDNSNENIVVRRYNTSSTVGKEITLLDNSGNSSFPGIVTVSNNTDSTNTSTGALVVAGGVGIGDTLNVGHFTIGGAQNTDAGKSIASNSTIFLKTTASSSSIFCTNSAERSRFNPSGMFEVNSTATQSTHRLLVNGKSAFVDGIAFTNNADTLTEYALASYDTTNKLINITAQTGTVIQALMPRNMMITGSGTAGVTYVAANGDTPATTGKPALWRFNLGIATPANGTTITVTVPVAGHTYGVWVSTDNGTTYKPVSVNGTARLTTHYPVNNFVTLVYDADGSTASIHPVAGKNSTSGDTVTGGCWRVVNYYDSGNDMGIRVYNQTSGYNADYPFLVSRTALSTQIGTKNSNSSYSNAIYGVIWNSPNNGTHNKTPTVNINTGMVKLAYLTIQGTTASSSTTTGALVVKGGVGIAGKLYVGSSTSLGGQTTINYTTAASTTVKSGQLIVQSGTDSNSVALEFYRNSNASWQIINEAGALKFRNNYTDAVQTTYVNTGFSLMYNTHLATFYNTVTIENNNSSSDVGFIVNNNRATNPHKVGYIVGSSGRAGIYDYTYSKWLIRAENNGNIILGNLSGEDVINIDYNFTHKSSTNDLTLADNGNNGAIRGFYVDDKNRKGAMRCATIIGTNGNTYGYFEVRAFNGTTDQGYKGIALSQTKAGVLNCTIAGALTVQGNIQANCADSGGGILLNNNHGTLWMHIASSGNQGIYSSNYWNGSSKVSTATWLVYRDTSGNIHMPGNADTATRINGNLTAQSDNVNANIWVSDGTPTGIPKYISGFYINPGSKTMAVPASIIINQPADARNNGIIGTYDYTKAAAIWSMGTPYQIAADGSGLGTLYGAAYGYQNQACLGGSTYASGHQFLWCENGAIKVALGQNIWTSGTVISEKASGEGMVMATNGGNHKVYLYCNSDGRSGMYGYTTGGTGYTVFSTAAGATTSTFYGNVTGSSASCTGNSATASTAASLYTGSSTNTTAADSDARIVAAIQSWFNTNKATVNRNAAINLYLSIGNGVSATGYFLSGYDSSPYGGFFIAHYGTPRYCGISNGTYTCYELVRNDSRSYSIDISGNAATATRINGNLAAASDNVLRNIVLGGNGGNGIGGDLKYGSGFYYNTSTKALTVPGTITGTKVYNAVWNDYAECRAVETTDPGYCVTETSEGKMIKTTKRLQAGCKLTSDTYGSCMGETDTAKTPIAVAGRVLAYPYRDKSEYHLGDAVCSAPDGKIDIMTRDEIMMYPERIVGTVSEIPTYDIWQAGNKENPENIQVNGRIWIYVR